MAYELLILLSILVTSMVNLMLTRRNGTNTEAVLKKSIYGVLDLYLDKIRKQSERARDKVRTDTEEGDETADQQFQRWLKEQNVL